MIPHVSILRWLAFAWLALGVPLVTGACFQLSYSLNYWPEWLKIVPPAIAGALGLFCVYWQIGRSWLSKLLASGGYVAISFLLYFVVGLFVACSNGDCL